MAARRHFLGYDAPMLPKAAAWLLDRHAHGADADLSNVIAVVPGGRAGRRLLQLLVEQAEDRRLNLHPPRIMTGGPLPEQLYKPSRALAEPAACRQAWMAALRETDAAMLGRIAPRPPAADDRQAWWALAELLERLHAEVAAGGMMFREVPGRAAVLADFNEAPRWLALADVQRAYLDRLDAAGLTDRQVARLDALRDDRCRTDDDIVLIAAPEGGQALRGMLEQVVDRVDALIFAPEALADRFDALGWVKAEAWLEAPIELPEDAIEHLADAGEQADAAVRSIADLDGRYGADQITLGVADERVIPLIRHRMELSALPYRYLGGTPVAWTSPYRLLEAAAEYLDARRFVDLATLLRHPHVEWFVDRAADRDRVGLEVADWLTLMDDYYADHLHGRLSGQWLGPPDRRRRLKQVHDAVDELLGELAGPPRRLGQWSAPLLDLLARAFGSTPLDTTDPSQRLIWRACGAMAEAVEQLAALPEALDGQSVSATQMIQLILRRLRDDRIAPEADDPAIEMLGWLELMLDDAEALIVTGMNDGLVPESMNADPFLPNHLRSVLGLLDNDRRYARDAYALTAIAHSRPVVKLLAARRSVEGEPLSPSRLLLAADDQTIVHRIRRFYPDAPATRRPLMASLLSPAPSLGVVVPPPTEPAAEPIRSLRVTAFRDYLACPYRFYLRHVLGLEARDDSAVELDAAQFGNLIHEVLAAFGRDERIKHATDSEAIARWCDRRLDDLFAQRYGRRPQPAALVQREQARTRLRGLAGQQAAWRQEGWMIEHCEIDAGKRGAPFPVDGVPFALRGRIDRIDRHESDNRWRLIDYKTGDKADAPERSPDRTHRRRDAWVDLQLPLYRHLAAAFGITGQVELGYVVLPRNPANVMWRAAQWDARLLDEADQTARQVVRALRAGRFEFDPTRPPPPFDPFGVICGVDQFAGTPDDSPDFGAGGE